MTAVPVPPGADASMWAELHRPFRPRLGRVAPWVAAVVWAVTLPVLAFTLPGAGVADAVGFLAVAAAGVVLMTRFAQVSATPGDSGLEVRNLLAVRELTWPEIVAVTYGRDATFAHLDLADGTTQSVLAIQAADGRFGAREASRLATLVEIHSR